MVASPCKKREQHRTVKNKKNSRCQTDSTKRVTYDFYKTYMQCADLNASRPPEHPPVMGKNVKPFRWDHKLQIQNLFIMAFKRVSSPMVGSLSRQYNFFPLTGGCSEGLGAFRFFLKKYRGETHRYAVEKCQNV